LAKFREILGITGDLETCSDYKKLNLKISTPKILTKKINPDYCMEKFLFMTIY
jgi:hypothetical protein